VIVLRLGVTAEDQFSAVSGGEMHVEHLEGGELLQNRARREAGGQRSQAGAQTDVQA